MNKKVLSLFFLLFFAMGFSSVKPLKAQDQAPGKPTPVITRAFASREMRPGGNWLVYLNASDSKGQMKYIVSEIWMPGAGSSSASYTRIKAGEGKELSGYVYLNVFGSDLETRLNQNFINLTLVIYIKDKSGNFSAPAVFPLSFNSRYAQSTPPAGVFKDEDLGPIMIRLGDMMGGMGE